MGHLFEISGMAIAIVAAACSAAPNGNDPAEEIAAADACSYAYWEQHPSCPGDLAWCTDAVPARPGYIVLPVIGLPPADSRTSLWCLDGPPSTPHEPGVPPLSGTTAADPVDGTAH